MRAHRDLVLAEGLTRATLGSMRVLAVVCLFVGLLACGEPAPLPTEKSEFAGQWEGDGVRLQITGEGRVSYDRRKGAGNEHVTGPIAGWQGDSFVVGVMTQKTTFEVSEAPHEVSGTWTMTVNGDTVYRVGP